MKRRLDLALALVHGPEILFLDEPATGLDPQSRSSLWEEVERLADDEGMTVFLTTQYLEEADRLADRVGIIDRGKIVAEGTPATLKAEVGEPSVSARAADPSDRGRLVGVSGGSAPPRGPRTRMPHGFASTRAAAAWSRSSARLDAEGLQVADLQLHEPTLDDVFLEKTDASSRVRANRVTSPGEFEAVSA